VVGETLDVVREPVGMAPLDRLDDPRVEDLALRRGHARVRDLVGERVPEGVLGLGRGARLGEKFRGLETGAGVAEHVLPDPGHRLDDRERHVLADHRRDFEQSLVLRSETADPAEEHLLDRVRHREGPRRPTLLPHRAPELLDEERVALGLRDNEVGEGG